MFTRRYLRVDNGTVFTLGASLAVQASCSDGDVLADASHTSTVEIWSPDPGVTIYSSSGHSYAPASCTPAPTVDQQPNSVVLCHGDDGAAFTITGSGNEQFLYFWQYRNAAGQWITLIDGLNVDTSTGLSLNVTGSLESTLSVASFVPGSHPGGSVLLLGRVATPCGTVAGNPVTLSLGYPRITSPVSDAFPEACEGSATSFSVQTSGLPQLAYRWQRVVEDGSCSDCYQWIDIADGLLPGGTTIGGSGSPTLSLSNISAADGVLSGKLYFHCVVTNACGAATSPYTQLQVLTAPTIVQQPSSIVIQAGDPVTIEPVMSGVVFGFEWFRDGISLPSFFGSPTFHLDHAGANDAGVYTFRASNGCAATTSTPVTLTVTANSTGSSPRVFAVNAWLPLLNRIDIATGAIAQITPMTLPGGGTIDGATSLALDTSTGVAYTALWITDDPSQQPFLATIDLATGSATVIGNLGDYFDSIAFTTSGSLYGVTSSVAAVPSTLYTINKFSAAKTFVLTLSNSGFGNAIAFNPDNGKLYHATGGQYDPMDPAAILESIDLDTLATSTITRSGYAGSFDGYGYQSELSGMAYAGAGDFYAVNSLSEFMTVSTSGVFSLLGTSTLTTPVRGLAIVLPSGACCTGPSCSIALQTACIGQWQGAGIVCGASANPTTCCRANFNGTGGVAVQDIFAFLAAWFSSDPRADFNGINGVGVVDIFDFLAAWFIGC